MRRAVRDSRELRPGGSAGASASRRREQAARAAAARRAEELTGPALSSRLDGSQSEKAQDAAQDWLEKQAEAEGQRPFWPRPRHFLFCVLSCVLGVGGVVFWPQLLADYGGAFVVASGVLLLTVHLPLLFLEVGLGQFSSSGPLHVFRHVLPALEAVGWAQLLLGLYYGLVNAFYAASNVYLLLSVMAGNGGDCCVDPAREPTTYNSVYCTSGLAAEACRDLGTGREEPRWLVGGRCHAAGSLNDHYLRRLQACWANASAGRPVDKPFCSVALHLYFNGTAPLGFFRLQDRPAGLASALLHPDSPEAARFDTACFGSLFKEKQRCVLGLQPVAESLDWGAKVEGRREASLSGWEEREMVIDLRDWHERSEETSARAACLHRLLDLADLDLRTCEPARAFPPPARPPAAAAVPPKTGRHTWSRTRREAVDRTALPVLACLLRSYCAATFPSEAGLGDVACARRVLSPVPSFSTFERDRLVYGYKGPDSLWSPRLWVATVAAWPPLLALVRGGVRRIGKLSFLLGVLPLIIILGQTSVVLFWPELLPGFFWALRLDWCRLLEPRLWVRASAMNFFCLGLGKGVLMTQASYNRFHQDCLRDAILAALASFCSCVTSGAVMIGYTAALGTKLSLEPVHLRDTGINVVEQIMQTLDEDSNLFLLLGNWNLIFFTLTTLCSVVLAAVTAASDEVEWLRLKWGPLVAAASVLVLLTSMALYGQTGGEPRLYAHVFLVESVVTPASQLVLVVLLVYAYGGRRLLADLAMMADGGKEYREGSLWGTGRALVRGRGRKWLLGSWALVTPLGLAALTGLAVGGEAWEAGLTLLGGLALLFVPTLLWSLLKRKISPTNLFRARLDWAPALEEHRTGRYCFSMVRSEALLGRAHKDVFFRAGPAAELRLESAVHAHSDTSTHYSNVSQSSPNQSPPSDPDEVRTVRVPRTQQLPPMVPEEAFTIRVPGTLKPPPIDPDAVRTIRAKAPKPRSVKAVSSSPRPHRQPPQTRTPRSSSRRKPRSNAPKDLSFDTTKDTPTLDDGGGTGSPGASFGTTTKDQSGASTTGGRSGPSTSLGTRNATASPVHSLNATSSGTGGLPPVPSSSLPRTS